MCRYSSFPPVRGKFILSQVRVSGIDGDVKKSLKERFIHGPDEHYSKETLHMNAENELAMKSNEMI